MPDLTLSASVIVLGILLVLAVGVLAGYRLRGRLDVRRRARRQRRLAEIREQASSRQPYRNTARPTPTPSYSRPPLDDGHPLVGASRPEPRTADQTVLVVDDRLELLALHASYLERAGYRVLTAEDGEAALAIARRDHPSVLVLDHSMPKLTGIEVARKLKADPATSDIAILLMTAHSYGAIGTTAMQAGCDAFLPKPCDPGRVLKEVIRHSPGGVAGV